MLNYLSNCRFVGMAWLLMMLTACAGQMPSGSPEAASVMPVVLRTTVSMQDSHFPNLTEVENRYATEQQAKLKAYRQLSSQVYQQSLDDQVQVADQVLKHEAYRVYADLYLREAEVVESEHRNGQREIGMQLVLTPRFYGCMQASIEGVSECIREDNKIPFTRLGFQPVATTQVSLDCVFDQCGSLRSVQGFGKRKPALDQALLRAGIYDTQFLLNTGAKTFLYYLFYSNVIFE